MMQTVKQILANAKQQLSAITDNSNLEAELLLAHTLNQPRSYLHAWPDQPLTDKQIENFTNHLKRRLNQEPIAYITGTKEFWSLELLVTPDTLIPRPETEILIEIILELFKTININAADLGTGSGAIALALAHERPDWNIYATDVSDNALQIARKNAQRLSLHNVSFYLGNWCTALPCSAFDVIVSNPPYISAAEWAVYADGLAYEPEDALVSGADGLDAIREISLTAKNYLKRGGYVLLEHGYLQGKAVREILEVDGYVEIRSILDLSGQERATLGRLPL